MNENGAARDKNIHEDSFVTLHYRITVLNGAVAGTVFVDTFSMRPATLQLGVGQWAPGLEQCLLGLPDHGDYSFEVDPAEAYGERNPALVQWVSRAQVLENASDDASFNPGDTVEFVAPTAQRYAGVLKQWQDDQALIDFNHPLAGAQIRLDVKILGIL
ncbi:MAG TPA: FKBP-type peptidyl-prolyl cis-trans isomerase [Paenalcaligenes sp.]|nr:FKBP-type peptidyl-prolyl cis-trans isomerase [Paenalcaligenes sp.]